LYVVVIVATARTVVNTLKGEPDDAKERTEDGGKETTQSLSEPLSEEEETTLMALATRAGLAKPRLLRTTPSDTFHRA
jgi:hypothetical protein